MLFIRSNFVISKYIMVYEYKNNDDLLQYVTFSFMKRKKFYLCYDLQLATATMNNTDQDTLNLNLRKSPTFNNDKKYYSFIHINSF